MRVNLVSLLGVSNIAKMIHKAMLETVDHCATALC